MCTHTQRHSHTNKARKGKYDHLFWPSINISEKIIKSFQFTQKAKFSKKHSTCKRLLLQYTCEKHWFIYKLMIIFLPYLTILRHELLWFYPNQFVTLSLLRGPAFVAQGKAQTTSLHPTFSQKRGGWNETQLPTKGGTRIASESSLVYILFPFKGKLR